MNASQAIRYGYRLPLFAAVAILTVALPAILLALHIFLGYNPHTRDLIPEVGIWAVFLTVMFATLFRALPVRLFAIAVAVFALLALIIGLKTGGTELLHFIYIDGSYVPPYYVSLSFVIGLCLLIAWEGFYRLKIRSAVLFIAGLATVAALIVLVPGYLLIWNIPV